MRRSVLITAITLLNASWLHAVNPFVTGADARPRVAGGKIVIDAIDDATGQLVQNASTFGWNFQTIPGDPYFLQDPGFNAVSGSGLPAGSFLGFTVTRGLSYFGGTGPVGFGATPSGEAISFSFGAGTVGISATTGAQPGFNFATVASNGSTHRHLNSNLIAGLAPTPTNGIYLTAIRVTNTGGPAASDPLFLVFNNGAPAADFARALNYVANPFAGDTDFSGSVTLDDFTALAANFGGAGPKFWYDGDFNRDYGVNLDDFTLLAANFGQSAPAEAGRAAVPEPTTISLCLLVALPLLGRRMR